MSAYFDKNVMTKLRSSALHDRAMILPMTFTSDELFLALISLVRATRPAMLRQEADGFSVDFQAIASSTTPGPADRLLLKIGAQMNSPAEATPENSNEPPADGSSSTPQGLAPAEAGAQLSHRRWFLYLVHDVFHKFSVKISLVPPTCNDNTADVFQGFLRPEIR